jgi:hypothetical protein
VVVCSHASLGSDFVKKLHNEDAVGYGTALATYSGSTWADQTLVSTVDGIRIRRASGYR